MSLCGWSDCSPAVRDQVTGLVERFQWLGGSAIRGMYLHGSLAYGCFNPHHSDVDLLVVTTRTLLPDTKYGLIQACLRCSQQPAPLELSVLGPDDLVPWHSPTPYQLHYSEAWRGPLTAATTGLAWLAWPAGTQGTDPDLAAHITLARSRGIALFGPPAADVFPEVPAADYLASIVADSEAALTTPLTNPVATILNLCRVAWYLRAHRLGSKEEAAIWAQTAARPIHRELISQALAVYRGAAEPPAWDSDAIRRFGHQVLAATAVDPAEPSTGPAQQLSLGADR